MFEYEVNDIILKLKELKPDDLLLVMSAAEWEYFSRFKTERVEDDELGDIPF